MTDQELETIKALADATARDIADPFVRRSVVLLAAAVIAFWLGFAGVRSEGRRRILLCALAVLLLGSALGLWVSSAFSWSWGWWL
jgi:cation transport ATPase